MNTIMITGTVNRSIGKYVIRIWGSKTGKPLQYVRVLTTIEGSNHNTVWQMAKQYAAEYFNDPQFLDGAYTQFIEDIYSVPSN